nr:hypothetical protein [Tanacetum cinerariifolium]
MYEFVYEDNGQAQDTSHTIVPFSQANDKEIAYSWSVIVMYFRSQSSTMRDGDVLFQFVAANDISMVGQHACGVERIYTSWMHNSYHLHCNAEVYVGEDNAPSAVTYTAISSDSDRPSWGILLINADEFPKMDPYEEVAQQGQVHSLLPAYVPDPMELNEHVPVYVLEPKHPKYHAPSDDDIPVEDDDEDPEEDPNEEHESEDDDEDPEEDPNEEHELEDEDTKEPSEGSDETKLFEEDETSVTPPPPRHHRARISVRPRTPTAASTHALIDAFTAGSSLFPLPPTSPAHD